MNILSIFQPGTVVDTTGTVPLPPQVGSYAIFINESQSNLNITLPSGNTLYLPSYDKRMVRFIGQMAQPAGFITWKVQSVPLSVTLLANQVVIELYQKGECTPEIYPAPLIRQLRAFS